MVLHNLGVAHSQLGEAEQAEAVLERALRIRRRALGDVHPQVVGSMRELAQVKARRGSVEEARRLFLEVVAVDEELHGLEHAQVATDLEIYAEFLASIGDLPAAERMRSRASAIRSDRPEPR